MSGADGAGAFGSTFDFSVVAADVTTDVDGVDDVDLCVIGAPLGPVVLNSLYNRSNVCLNVDFEPFPIVL